MRRIMGGKLQTMVKCMFIHVDCELQMHGNVLNVSYGGITCVRIVFRY